MMELAPEITAHLGDGADVFDRIFGVVPLMAMVRQRAANHDALPPRAGLVSATVTTAPRAANSKAAVRPATPAPLTKTFMMAHVAEV